MFAGLICNFSAAFGSAQESDLQKIWLNDVLQSVPFFTERGGYGLNAGRPAVINVNQRT